MPYGLIPLIVFWVLIARLWKLDGPRIPLVFAALWLAALLSFPLLQWQGIPFQLYVCFLAIMLALIERYKSTMRTFR